MNSAGIPYDEAARLLQAYFAYSDTIISLVRTGRAREITVKVRPDIDGMYSAASHTLTVPLKLTSRAQLVKEARKAMMAAYNKRVLNLNYRHVAPAPLPEDRVGRMRKAIGRMRQARGYAA